MSEHQLATFDSVSPDDVLRQIQMVQQLMSKAMIDGTHYGAIPGTGQKKNFLKPGADKLCLMFRLAPTYVVESIDRNGGHREVKVICTLTQITTGRAFSQGVGSCSTMESKYRYRHEVVTDEDGRAKSVPGKYWETRAPELLGGPELSAKKVDGKWFVCRKVEAVDLADQFNAVLKMAKKRAYVDATITATEASDIFTQDLEEIEQPKFDQDKKPDYETKASGYATDGGAKRRQKEATDVAEEIQGVVTEAGDKPAQNKDGKATGETLFFAKIGGQGVWTKDREIGQELLDSSGLEIEAFVVNSGKSLRLVEVRIPDKPTRSEGLELEPEDLDWGEKKPQPTTDSDVPF